MSELYRIVSSFDISTKNVAHCAAKFNIPHAAQSASDMIGNLDADFVEAPASRQVVMIEKPLTQSLPSVKRIIDAEKASGGSRVFAGYMCRYAPGYLEAFKREIATIPQILYARVRDFSGPNAKFVSESGPFSIKNSDFPAEAGIERDARLQELIREEFQGQEITDDKRRMCRFLGSTGSHDISLM